MKAWHCECKAWNVMVGNVYARTDQNELVLKKSKPPQKKHFFFFVAINCRFWRYTKLQYSSKTNITEPMIAKTESKPCWIFLLTYSFIRTEAFTAQLITHCDWRLKCPPTSPSLQLISEIDLHGPLQYHIFLQFCKILGLFNKISYLYLFLWQNCWYLALFMQMSLLYEKCLIVLLLNSFLFLSMQLNYNESKRIKQSCQKINNRSTFI